MVPREQGEVMPQRASGYRDDDLPTDIRCPDCGKVRVHADVFERGNPVSGLCPECGERLYFEEERRKVFDNCNVCGRRLHTEDEDAMGMCLICADE